MNGARKMDKIMQKSGKGYIFLKLVPSISSPVLKIIDSFHSYSSLLKAKTVSTCSALFLPVHIPVHNSCIPENLSKVTHPPVYCMFNLKSNAEHKSTGKHALGKKHWVYVSMTAVSCSLLMAIWLELN
jgi:hypothetical protein